MIVPVMEMARTRMTASDPRRASLLGRAREASATGETAGYIAEKPKTLPIFKHYQPAAGDPDWQRLLAEAEEIVAEARPMLERPRRGLAELGRRTAAYRQALGNFRKNRSLARQGREDLRPLYFIWTLLRNCNFGCEYCDDHQGRRYPELPKQGTLDTEQGRKLLEIMRTGTCSVYFAGGEPTMRKDLPELTRAARDLGYFPIVINTNGSLFHKVLRRESWRTFLADIDIVVVSLDALRPARLNELWVTERSQDVLRNLLVLWLLSAEMRFKLMVNTVILPGAAGDARAVLDFANDMGIWFCPVPVNQGPTVAAELAGDREYDELVAAILDRKRAGYRVTGSLRMNERLLRSAPLHCRNTLKPHIDHDGRLVWPCKATVNVKPEYINVLDFKDVDTLYDYAASKVNPTKFHGPACNQCGANCNWAQNYTTDTYFNGLVHPLSMVRDAFEFLS